MYYIGIDLGTSAVKLLLMDETGEIHKTVSREYPIRFPKPGWSEQDPERWLQETLDGIAELTAQIDKTLVKGIGCGGQMHGLVILDESDRVIRPAILWNDGRTAEEVQYLNGDVGFEKLSEYTANIAFAGFTAPKLLWLKKHEKENFERIAKIMLPKDYINYCLTGVHSCDYSDASGMLLLDVKNKCWSKEMLTICGITNAQMPALYESYEVTGTLKPKIADKTGLSTNVKVVAGAGDNASAAVGTGTVGEGACNISLGTSGTIFISSERFGVDPNNALHAFAHADGNYHLMGCMLSAASCNKWWMDDVLEKTDYASEQTLIKEQSLGRNHVFFLPYLMGERSPINDVEARGTFVGMTMDTTRADMTQAVLEGVAFAIRDSLEVARSTGIRIGKSRLCGGGAKSPLWQRLIADICNLEIELPLAEEGPGYGAAILAMVGCGTYLSVQEAATKLVKVKKRIAPDPETVERYEARYQQFRKIYPALKPVYPILNSERDD